MKIIGAARGFENGKHRIRNIVHAEISLLFIENGFHVLDEPDARGVDKTYIFHVQGKVGLAPGQGFLEKFAHIGEGLYRKIAGKVEKDEITVNAGGYVH